MDTENQKRVRASPRLAPKREKRDTPAELVESPAPEPEVVERTPDIPNPDYWFWKLDGHSYTEAELVALRESDLVSKGDYEEIIETPGGGKKSRFSIQCALTHFKTSLAFCPDKTRKAGDTACSISHMDFSLCEPYLLNLNGRSYALGPLLDVVTRLAKGYSVRLEDITIEPEQVIDIEFFANQSLGAQPLPKYSFKHFKSPINPFDDTVPLEDRPEFWKDVNVPDKNEMWSMESAALKHGFINSLEQRVVIANQLCKKVMLLHPHPKMNVRGEMFFRNCRFVECEINIACWCGPRFRGCEFVDCTFIWKPSMNNETAAKRCRIIGGRLINKDPNVNGEHVLVWMRKYIGQEGIQGLTLEPPPTGPIKQEQQ